MSKQKKSPSMRDIAKAAGVHVTTVSLALRNSPQLPLKTRERIRQIAQRMDYRPNPLVVALVQQRRNANTGISLGFISRTPKDKRLVSNKYIGSLLKHTTIRARELGFGLDALDLADYGHDPRRLQKTLHNRNISGVIIAPLPRNHEHLDLNWDSLAATTIGHSLRYEHIDRIDSDYYGGSLLAMEHCERIGYKRVGFLTLKRTDDRISGRWRAGFLAYLPQRKSFKALPPLITDDDNIEHDIVPWLRKHRPDALLANNSALEACESVFKGLDPKLVPKLIQLNIHDAESPMMGIYTKAEIKARIAVDVLSAKLYRNEIGPTIHPLEILTPAVWHEGQS